jgi:hypothetical protein
MTIRGGAGAAAAALLVADRPGPQRSRDVAG